MVFIDRVKRYCGQASLLHDPATTLIWNELFERRKGLSRCKARETRTSIGAFTTWTERTGGNSQPQANKHKSFSSQASLGHD